MFAESIVTEVSIYKVTVFGLLHLEAPFISLKSVNSSSLFFFR